MNKTVERMYLVVFSLLFLGLSLDVSATELVKQPPASREAGGPNPGSIVKRLAERRAPSLTGSGETARKNAEAFIEWASASTKAQSEIVRRALNEARKNKDVINTFCDAAFRAQKIDHSRALITLSLIGEARSPIGEQCLVKFIRQPLPERGTVVDGEILEQTALATLQAKAVDGLAYLRSEEADRQVLEAAGRHPSRIVRAEAITAYLWNHEYSEAAKATLQKYVQPKERIFIDRVVKVEGEGRETFNKKLETYLRNHPEVVPPPPAKKPREPRGPEQPPKF